MPASFTFICISGFVHFAQIEPPPPDCSFLMNESELEAIQRDFKTLADELKGSNLELDDSYELEVVCQFEF